MAEKYSYKKTTHFKDFLEKIKNNTNYDNCMNDEELINHLSNWMKSNKWIKQPNTISKDILLDKLKLTSKKFI